MKVESMAKMLGWAGMGLLLACAGVALGQSQNSNSVPPNFPSYYCSLDDNVLKNCSNINGGRWPWPGGNYCNFNRYHIPGEQGQGGPYCILRSGSICVIHNPPQGTSYFCKGLIDTSDGQASNTPCEVYWLSCSTQSQ